MFGHRSGEHPHRREGPGVDVDDDDRLETALQELEVAVGVFLGGQSRESRFRLIEAVGVVDEMTADADAYAARFWDLAPRPRVVGASGFGTIADRIARSEFEAQVVLVRAAKAAVTRLTRDALDELRDAYDAMAVWRGDET